MKKLIYLLLLAAVLGSPASAQSTREDSPEDLKKYVPVLPSVKSQFWKIDPNLGYAVKNVGGEYTSFPTTDGSRHSLSPMMESLCLMLLQATEGAFPPRLQT